MLGKRGQFYLVGAIIIVIVVYSLATRVNVFQEQPRFTDFNRLAENYVSEASKVVNHGIYNRITDIRTSLLSPFTLEFINYARTRDPNIGLVYVYADGSQTIIENHVPGQVVNYNSATGPSGTIFSSDTDSISDVSLRIGDEQFIHDVPVKLSSFSNAYYTASVGSGVDFLRLDLAGVGFTSQPAGSNFFDVIIRTQDESSGNINVKTCRYDSSLGGWQSCT